MEEENQDQSVQECVVEETETEEGTDDLEEEENAGSDEKSGGEDNDRDEDAGSQDASGTENKEEEDDDEVSGKYVFFSFLC